MSEIYPSVVPAPNCTSGFRTVLGNVPHQTFVGILTAKDTIGPNQTYEGGATDRRLADLEARIAALEKRLREDDVAADDDTVEEKILRFMRATPIGAQTHAASLGVQAEEILRRHGFEFPEVAPGVFAHANPTWPSPLDFGYPRV